MAKKDAFLLVSLEDDKARKLAAVVGNESCRKIMNYLAEKEDATESDVAKDLGLPLSTTHYNLQLLQQSGLVTAEEFHYSKKGREVLHYRLANKYIVIAPKSAEGVVAKLKRLVPALLFLGVSSLALQAAISLIGAAGEAGSGFAQRTADKAAESAPALAAQLPEKAANFSALFLLAGGLLALAAYFIYDVVRDRIK